MKILLLEDNVRLANLIKKSLEDENYEVDFFTDGCEALDALANGYKCFILDINVPSLDGLSILQALKIYKKDIFIIIISSNHELNTIYEAYEIGCDDYLKKPFYIYELVKKVNNFFKKDKNIIEFWQGYKYELSSKRLYDINQNEISLAKKEILFLELFLNDTKAIVTYEQMYEYVWQGQDTNIENIRALIKRFRKKLPKNAIQSVKDIGYRLCN